MVMKKLRVNVHPLENPFFPICTYRESSEYKWNQINKKRGEES